LECSRTANFSFRRENWEGRRNKQVNLKAPGGQETESPEGATVSPLIGREKTQQTSISEYEGGRKNSLGPSPENGSVRENRNGSKGSRCVWLSEKETQVFRRWTNTANRNLI